MMVPRMLLIAVCSIFPLLSSVQNAIKTHGAFCDRSVIQN